jgi:hypothetical protein
MEMPLITGWAGVIAYGSGSPECPAMAGGGGGVALSGMSRTKGCPSRYLGETYDVEIRPMKEWTLSLVNHMAPSGPAVIPIGMCTSVGPG